MQEAKAQQYIRESQADVFDAFVNPTTITKFWLDRTTGAIARDAKIEWTFMVPNATDTVRVTDFRENELIAFQWSDGTNVSMDFEPRLYDCVAIARIASSPARSTTWINPPRYRIRP